MISLPINLMDILWYFIFDNDRLNILIKFKPFIQEFSYRDILQCAIEDFIGNRNIAAKLHYRSTGREVCEEDDMSLAITEPWTADWWIEMQQKLPHDISPIVIVLYADSTVVVQRGTRSFHPFYMSLLNLSTDDRYEESNKQLVALLPHISVQVGSKKERKSHRWRQQWLKIVHECIELLLQPIRSAPVIGPLLDAAGSSISITPRLGFAITDFMESCLFCLTYGPKGNHPCVHCLCHHSQQHEINGHFECRTEEKAKDKVDRAIGLGINGKSSPGWKLLQIESLYPVKNAFWNLPDVDVYQLTPSDIMHMLEEGIYKRFLQALFLRLDAEHLHTIDIRLSQWSRLFPSLKPLPFNVSDLTSLEASHYVTIMQLLPLAIADICYEEYVQLACDWVDIFKLSCSSFFFESSLNELDTKIKSWANSFVEIFGEDVSDGNFPKFHLFVCHFVNFIRRFGNPMGFHSGTWEGFHVRAIKAPFKKSNHKYAHGQIISNEIRSSIISCVSTICEATLAATNDSHVTNSASSSSHDHIMTRMFSKVNVDANSSNGSKLIGRKATIAVDSLDEDMISYLSHFCDSNKSLFSEGLPATITVFSGFKCSADQSDIIRSATSFHHQERVDDVLIDAGEGTTWVGRVLQLLAMPCLQTIYTKKCFVEVAIVQWYEKITENSPGPKSVISKSSCTRLQLLDQIDAITATSIIERVMVVPDPEFPSNYILNDFLFK